MRIIARNLSALLLDATRHYPAVVITGPRRSGKTTLLRSAFPGSQYVLLEDPDVQARIRSDPRAFLEGFHPPVIFDEIQNTPELFDYGRTLIDTSPRRMGQWLFTGSQEAPLMKGITESMAGRAAVLQLLPFSLAETPRVSLLYGGFPEVLSRPRSRELWFASYLQTYLERDVRSVTGVRDLATFRRFLALIASRHGQILNRTDLSAPLGVSVPTISAWLHVLEVTGQIILVPPYFENFGKRLIKSPKLYIGDSGLACFLLGLRSAAEVERSPFLGPLFEGFVASEILKHQVNRGMRKELYYFRDQQGLEVDFLLPRPNATVWMVEAKASKTVVPSMAGPLKSLQSAAMKQTARMLIVHRKSRSQIPITSVTKGVEALDFEEFVNELARTR